MDFIKSYEIDYSIFKRRFKNAGLGTILDAKNTWRHLLSGNQYLKKKSLEKLKRAGVSLKGLTTLSFFVRSL